MLLLTRSGGVLLKYFANMHLTKALASTRCLWAWGV